jgi:hypothetical protein
MRHSPIVKPSALVACGAALLLQVTATAQFTQPTGRSPAERETDRYRVRRVTVPAGGRVDAEGRDSVVVVLTADLDGRMPQAEAAWQPSGPRVLDNRGVAPFEAIVIELKDAPATGGVTPPEATGSSDYAEASPLIDNARVLVTKLRYAQSTFVDPMHAHANDTVVVYLNAGYSFKWGEARNAGYALPGLDWYAPGGWYAGAQRVTRADVDVVPANTIHSFGNAGGDPLEFLAVLLK